MSQAGAALSVKNVTKSYGDKVVLKDISFDVKPGEFVVLVGPSGCGKSTMLRSIAGLEDIQGGEIELNGRMISGLAPKDRDIAMVFQDYALYPHKNVYENIAFGLRIRKMDSALIDERVQEAAAKLNLTELLERRPAALSGGQRQRVAIGRAIVRQPKAFLFDEPLSNLDAKLRGTMRIEISKLHHDLSATVLYVTHDQIEAMTLADRIIVFNDGHIQQMGTPLDLYYHPNNVFVATFIGSPSMNLISGAFIKSAEGWAYRSELGIEFRLSREQISELVNEPEEGREILWGIRPENMVFDADDEKGDLEFKAKVLIVEPHGPTTYLFCDIMGHEVQVMLPEPHRPARGDMVPLKFASKHLYLFDKKTGERA